jgi:catechol 2,3-dioxygenase
MKIGHIHLRVKNLKRAEDFYMKLLGASCSERVNNQYSFLSIGKAHHDIALQEIGELARHPTQDMVGLYHTAFEVSDAKELLKAIECLEGLGSEYSLVDHGISWAAYTSDPDGNGVEIYLDRRNAKGGSARWNGESRRLTKGEIGALT